MILEVTAAERAARHPASELIVRLREMAEAKYEPEEPESHISFLQINRRFHLTLAEAAVNYRIVDLLNGLFNEMERLFHLGLRLRDSSEEMRREHRDLITALENGDVETARTVISDQILASRDRILEAVLQGELHSIQIG